MGRRSSAKNRSHPRDVRASRDGLLDVGRARRTGAPEVILAEGKRTDDLVEIIAALARRGHPAFISRLTPTVASALRRAADERGWSLEVGDSGGHARLHGRRDPGVAGGRVAIVTAGTSDAAVADEADGLLRAYAVDVVSARDVGVAGLHRLTRAVRLLEAHRPQIYLAFAGREGALPTVLAGLVRAPVVGIPTSNGYGRGGRGEAALSAMLQSCAPVAVVNIDGAVPAALFALQLLAGAARQGRRP